MGVALEWEPWNWDLWDTPLEPDDDDASLEGHRKARSLKGATVTHGFRSATYPVGFFDWASALSTVCST